MTKSKKTSVKKRTIKIPKEFFKGIDHLEVANLKGQLEATKHYYATLIGKNVAKIEDVYGIIEPKRNVERRVVTLNERREVLFKRLTRTKSKAVKGALEEAMGLLAELRSEVLNHANEMNSIYQKLRQVV